MVRITSTSGKFASLRDCFTISVTSAKSTPSTIWSVSVVHSSFSFRSNTFFLLYSTRTPSPSLLHFQEQLSDRFLASKWLIPYRNSHSHFGESLVLLLMKTMINNTFILIHFLLTWRTNQWVQQGYYYLAAVIYMKCHHFSNIQEEKKCKFNLKWSAKHSRERFCIGKKSRRRSSILARFKSPTKSSKL